MGELLERCAAGPWRERHDLSASTNRGGGSGGALGRFFEVGPWFVKASLARRWPEPIVGEPWREEERAEATRRRLGICPPERLWAIVRGTDHAWWAVSATRRRLTLRALFEAEPNAARPWRLYLRAVDTALRVAEDHRVLLDCNPNNFGLDDPRSGELVYLDDDVPAAVGRLALGVQVLLRLREYAESPLERRLDFVDTLGALLRRRDRRQLVAWGLGDDLETRLLWPVEPELRVRLDAMLRWLDATPSSR